MSDDRQSLEALVADLARNQPLRRAPASLEQRVLAQLAERAMNLPWWRRGFTNWPLTARYTFLLASIAFVRLAVGGVLSVMSYVGSRPIAGTAATWVELGGRAVSVTESAASFVFHAIPPEWLYAAAAVGVVLYTLLFGLGAVAYRTLYVER